jgi:L-prolyl-PCP dehydrogenase
MDFSYSSDQTAFRQTVIDFARAELNTGARTRDAEKIFDRDLWRRCGEMGLIGLPVNESFGGIGADPLTTIIALEALGYGCEDGGLVFGVGAHLLACVLPVWLHASDEQKSRLFPAICDGSVVMVNGMTEETSGSDVFDMQTNARKISGGFLLNGTKSFASHAPVADKALVYAATDKQKGFHGGVTAFIVESGPNGFQRGQVYEKMGLRSCTLGELVFDDMFVSEENVLGQVGAGGVIFSESMNWERVGLAATHVGTMERLLELSCSYARERKSSGSAISKFQAISHRLVDMKADLEAARFLVYRAAVSLESDVDAAMQASIAKMFVSEKLVQNALKGLSVFGGYGYLTEFDVERTVRDSVASTIYSGTSDIQKNLIARWLGL